RPGVPIGVKFAAYALVEAALAQIGDIIFNHAAGDFEPSAEALPERLDVADAVLEADHQRSRRGMGGDLRGGFGRVRTLDGHSDDLDLSEAFGAAAIIDFTRRQMRLPTAIVAQRQAMRIEVF